jgi:hypothetical protein
VAKNAQNYIEAFRRGEDFTPPANGVIVQGRPDPAALALLGKELAAGDPKVRERIVALLVDMAVRTDPLASHGAAVLRDPQILDLLAGPGLSKDDLGREAAMRALRKMAPPGDLARFGDAITAVLERAPSWEAFLLVARAKPVKARPVVDRLANLPKWRATEELRIARAALGDQMLENSYLADLNAANDVKSFPKALEPASLIGTPRCLTAIAARLRTPLIYDMPGAYKKSLRLNVLLALLYNFPDQPLFNPNNIHSDADYAAAERFCTEKLQVAYHEPRPPFMTYSGYPIPR